MKRYRVLAVDFDTRAVILGIEVSNEWEPHIKSMWENNKRGIRDGLIFQYEAKDHEQKIANFIDLGDNPFSLVSFHNQFFRQCRDSFVVGAYYPALVSACTLGERILNRMVIHLRDYYKNTPEYKSIYRKDSFDNWELAVRTLSSWQILLPDVADHFSDLERMRHRAIHFNPETEENPRSQALSAINALKSIITKQFSGIGQQPWYIPGAAGAAYVGKACEKTPFVKEFVLPSCALVGPNHRLEHSGNGWKVHDIDYPDLEITDQEFVELISPSGSELTPQVQHP